MDLDSLPERLVADGNDFLMLANCYWFCAKPDNFATLAATLTVNPTLATLQSTLRAQFRQILKSGKIPALRDMLAAKTAEESLILASSLLRALSGHVVTVEGYLKVPTFEPVYVTPTFEPDCPDLSIAPRPSARVNPLKTPSQESDQALTMDEFHPELHIHARKIGACALEWKSLPRRTDEWLEDRINKGRLKIAVSGLLNEVDFDAGPVPGFPPDQQVRFRVPGVKDEGRQIEHLRQVLNACKERRVSILVLPEIRVTGALLAATQDFLRAQSDLDRDAGNALLVVVAGSRHVETETGWVNRAAVLDTDGDVVWEHDKLLSYRIHDPETIERLRPTLGLNEHGGIEAIIPGRSLTYCDCSLGRFSVAICVGFFHACGMNKESFLELRGWHS